MKIETHDASLRSEWLALRQRDVTASEIAALFGAHPYKTALQVYAEKTGASRGQGDNPAMRRGRILEGAVIEALREVTGVDYAKVNTYFRAPELRIGATPDYANAAGEPVECKTVAPDRWSEWNETPPLAYLLQAMVQAKLMGKSRAWIAVLVLNRAYDIKGPFEVPVNEAAWDRCVAGVAAFWESVAAGSLPNIDYTRDHDAIAALYPRASEPPIDLSADNLLPALLAERATIKERSSADEARLKTIDAEIKAKLGAASGATLPGWRITYKEQSRKETVIPATTFRVLRIAATGEKEKAE